MADPNLSEIITTTLRDRQKVLADNVSKGVAVLNFLSAKGRAKPVDGGRTIVEELDYQENSTFKYYSGFEALNIAAVFLAKYPGYISSKAMTSSSKVGLTISVWNAWSRSLGSTLCASASRASSAS